MIALPLIGGGETLVDDADADLVSGYRWRRHPEPSGDYVKTYKHRRVLFLHRLLISPPSGVTVDHIDGDRMNNCRNNLRLATPAQQSMNRKPMSASGFKGVYPAKGCERWVVTITKDGRSRYIGCFRSPEEAAGAYDNQARELFGEFARLNFSEATVTK